MRLKKLLAAVVSGALAVMSLASLPVSAAGETEEITVALSNIYLDDWLKDDDGNKLCVIQENYSGEAAWGDYETAVFTADVGTLNSSVKNISFYCMNSSWGEVAGTKTYIAAEQVTGSTITATVDFTKLSAETINTITGMLVRIETNSTTKISDFGLSNGKITLTQKEGVVVVPKDEWVTNADGKKEFTRGSKDFGSDGIPVENIAVSADVAKADVTNITVNITATQGGKGIIGINDASSTWTSAEWDSTGAALTDYDISMDISGIGADQANVQFQTHWANAGTKITINSVEFKTADDTPSDITLDKTTAEIKAGETVTLIATPAEGVTWTSDNTAVATVENGVVTGVAEGSATITATLGEKTATCTVTVTKADTEEPSETSVTLWEGDMDFPAMGENDPMLAIAADKFTNIKEGDTLKFTFEKMTNEAEPWYQLQIVDSSWAPLTSPTLNEYKVVDLTASPYSFVVNAADAANLKAGGMNLKGHAVTLFKVELISAGGSKPEPETLTIYQADTDLVTGETVQLRSTPSEGVIWTSSNVDVATVSANGLVTAVAPGTATITATLGNLSARVDVTVTAPAPVIPSIPSRPSYVPVIPTITVPAEPQLSGGSIGKGWKSIEEKISETVDGGKVTVDMNGTSLLPKKVLDSISGEDVDLVLNMKNGVTWTINGTDVDKASDIDMKVTVGTRSIPDEAIEAIEGRKGVKKISLSHNGTFGFTATMTISLGKINDGQYANLFYYNPKSKSLEFVDASIISGGRANLIFSHASDYAIIMSDAPLGNYEDVSAAAGVISSESADTTVFFACGAVVLAVAAAYVIYRKRSRG